MEIPSRHPPREFVGALPSIYLNRGDASQPFGPSMHSSRLTSKFSPALSSIPMAIPGSGSNDEAPPPLPPPRFPLDEQPGHHHLGSHHREFPDSLGNNSNYGSLENAEERPQFSRKWDAKHTGLDEGYASLSLTSSRDSVPTRFMSHDSFRLPGADKNGLDKSMLNKLDCRRTLDNRSPPRRSGLGSLCKQLNSRGERLPFPPKLMSLCERPKQMVDSPTRLSETPLSSAFSPRSMPFDYRSPTEPGELERSPIPRSRRTDSGSFPDDMTVSTQSSMCESHVGDTDFSIDEVSRLRGLHGDGERPDYISSASGAGQKRKPSSPPGDEQPPSMAGDVLRRREMGAVRGSPQPRLSVIPQGSTLSTSSSTGRGSYAGNLSLTMPPSSATSVGSPFSRLSPGSTSAGTMSPTDPTSSGSPFTSSMSLKTSPRAAIHKAFAGHQHQRNMSEQHQGFGQGPSLGARQQMASPRKLAEIPKSAPSVTKMSGFWMCDCCPKKPKKFDTQEELSMHEQEKQYECQYCGNRFKNKNEAERHQNSLHVRRHSWSCSALTGYERAFHESTARPGEADACGYCGEEFARTGPPCGGGVAGRYVSEEDWVERIRHLTDMHKFRECNSSKKFFRADHFRQHLKHSHQGVSGKWTNMLENACMIEEEPPLPPSAR